MLPNIFFGDGTPNIFLRMGISPIDKIPCVLDDNTPGYVALSLDQEDMREIISALTDLVVLKSIQMDISGDRTVTLQGTSIKVPCIMVKSMKA